MLFSSTNKSNGKTSGDCGSGNLSRQLRVMRQTTATVLSILALAATHSHASEQLENEPTSRPPLNLRLHASGLTAPVSIASAGDERLFVAEQAGRIRLINADGSVEAQPFLDISDRVANEGEQGLLGIAFHPDYANNGTFYVQYSAPGTIAQYRGVVSSFTVTANQKLADPASEQIVFQTHRNSVVHQGGDIRFGTDGFLYISSGDDAVRSSAQDPSGLLGKILRIDVDSTSALNPDCGIEGLDGDFEYAIPADNAFNDGPGGSGCDEVYALGFRNPWRISTDRSTGDLWIADVGQSTREEINLLPAGNSGLNLGWPCFEGTVADPSQTDCDKDFTSPVHDYDRDVGTSITGGFVYRGINYPSLRGQYIFTDYGKSSVIYTLFEGIDGWRAEAGLDGSAASSVTSFGEDGRGELFLASRSQGEIYQVQGDDVNEPPELSIEGTSVTEGIEDVATVRVQLTGTTSDTVTVQLATASDTAIDGEDFTGVTTDLTFAPGESTKTVDIEILDDDNDEENESFVVSLSDAEGATIVTADADVEIQDNDRSVPAFSITATNANESDGEVIATITLSEASNEEAQVTIRTVAGTAMPIEDYEEIDIRVPFTPGMLTGTVPIQIVNDTRIEEVEEFSIELFDAVGATIDIQSAVIAIEDDDFSDAEPELTISDANVDESAGSIDIPVRLSAASADPVSVGVATNGGTAEPGKDYFGASTRFEFNAGETEKVLSIEILPDTEVESDEIFTVRLFGEQGATIANDSATISIADSMTPLLSVSDTTVSEGATSVDMVVTLSEASAETVTVNYASAPDTALNGEDYYGASGSISFAPGELRQIVDIPILNDEEGESNEQFSFRIYNAKMAGIVQSSATVTVEDDD